VRTREVHRGGRRLHGDLRAGSDPPAQRLYDAKLDHQPVVAIVGQQARAGLGGNFQQEVDLQTLFKDVAHEYVEVCMDATQARHLIDRAVRIALDERTVTCVIVPNDVQKADAVPEPPRTHGTYTQVLASCAGAACPGRPTCRRRRHPQRR